MFCFNAKNTEAAKHLRLFHFRCQTKCLYFCFKISFNSFYVIYVYVLAKLYLRVRQSLALKKDSQCKPFSR